MFIDYQLISLVIFGLSVFTLYQMGINDKHLEEIAKLGEEMKETMTHDELSVKTKAMKAIIMAEIEPLEDKKIVPKAIYTDLKKLIVAREEELFAFSRSENTEPSPTGHNIIAIGKLEFQIKAKAKSFLKEAQNPILVNLIWLALVISLIVFLSLLVEIIR
jgi:hypothetical protein